MSAHRCRECGRPLDGRRRSFCTRRCRGDHQSRVRNSTRYAIREALRAGKGVRAVAVEFEVSVTYVGRLKDTLALETPEAQLQRYIEAMAAEDVRREEAGRRLPVFGPEDVSYTGRLVPVFDRRTVRMWRHADGCWTNPAVPVPVVVSARVEHPKWSRLGRSEAGAINTEGWDA